MAVQKLLKDSGLIVSDIQLGEATIETRPTEAEKKQLQDNLNYLGFELIDDKKSRIIEKIKTVIIDLVHHRDGELKMNLS
ncbi:MAG: AraC family transcriptional regulator, partial [Bacteroidetes bacterium]|nr:AraC family transcriptional regulator [Bacteroidota bacterium]